eukprot:TRINITY_DN4624_c0_g1_i2.p1 TRINITY_DN4624_c0_g1~~TRINITY_DN4624_c0_g1_i2.p1  ORF type:complete len:143 (+),score=23.94 TRINITY_DN4624_c0_g1_i2:296-724(+)
MKMCHQNSEQEREEGIPILLSETNRQRRRKLNVLELGSGCGWLGMALSINLENMIEVMCMTEQVVGGALDWLRHNVEINKKKGNHSFSNLKTCPCDWNQYITLTKYKNEVWQKGLVGAMVGSSGINAEYGTVGYDHWFRSRV